MDKTLVSICLGIGLAAACGFRVFVPFLVINLAARTGFLALTGSFAWLGSTPALVLFSVATLLEIGAYYVPWLDNALDAIAAPVAIAAGVIAAAAVVTGVDPMLKWTLAAIAGGGAAAAVHGATSLVRGTSTATTGGLGNFVVSSVEAVSSAVLSVVLLFVGPVLALAGLLLAILLTWRWLRNRREAGTAITTTA
jgi:hypothetical protein